MGGLLFILQALEVACAVQGLEAQPGARIFIDGNAPADVASGQLLHSAHTLGQNVAADGDCPSGPLARPHGAAAAAAASLDAAAAAAGSGGGRRHLLATYPSSATSGSASATFPADAFGAWCAADAPCAAAGSLTLSLLYHADASPFTSATLNWPNVFSGAGVSSLQLVSRVVELQFGNYAAKRDQLICGDAASNSSCSAQLSIPLDASTDLSKSFVCLRLEPSVTGGSYQAYGYPPGSDGTSLEVTAVNGALRCTTNRFGKHIIMQYKQSALLPPPPSPPPSPPPPPPLNTVGATYTSDVKLRLMLPLSLGFDTLKANESLLTGLTASLESSLAATLTASRTTLLLSPSTTISSSIYRISRSSSNSTTAVWVEIRLTVSAGATEGQLRALMQQLAARDTAALFSGSPYTSYFTASATASYISYDSDNSLGTGAIIAIALGTMVGTLLLLGAAYAVHRWRAYAAILPKKPEGSWDETGVAVVPRKSTRRHKIKEAQLDTAGDTDAAGGGGALPSPPSPPLPPPLTGAPTAEGKFRSEEFPWERSTQAAGVTGANASAGAGGPRVKSQAQLVSRAKEAWS